MKRPVASLLIASLLLVWGAVPATAAPGDLNPSFGEAGLVYTDFIGEAYGMALQTDGKIASRRTSRRGCG